MATKKKNQQTTAGRITCIVLCVILLLSAVIIGIIGWKSAGFKNWDGFKSNAVAEDPFKVEEIQNSPQLRLAFNGDATTAANGEYVEKKLGAYITPAGAFNKNINWSVYWADKSTSLNVSEYITLHAQESPTLIAVRAHKAFPKNITIKAVTEDGNHEATCTVRFVGIASSMDIQTTGFSKDGEYVLLGSNRTHNLSVNLSNIFNSTSSDLTVLNYGAKGSFYFGTFTSSYGGARRLSDVELKDLNQFKDKFFTSVIIDGTTLKITTGDKIFQNGWSESSIYNESIRSTTDYNYFFSDYVSSVNPDYKTHEEYNKENYDNYYFFVTIQDSISNRTATIKIRLITSVDSVSVDNELMF